MTSWASIDHCHVRSSHWEMHLSPLPGHVVTHCRSIDGDLKARQVRKGNERKWILPMISATSPVSSRLFHKVDTCPACVEKAHKEVPSFQIREVRVGFQKSQAPAAPAPCDRKETAHRSCPPGPLKPVRGTFFKLLNFGVIFYVAVGIRTDFR